jgi:hypothetical protein
VINLNHTIEEINHILAALDELPHRIARSIIDKIKGQAQPQVDAINLAGAAAAVDAVVTAPAEVAPAEPAQPAQGA